MSESAIESRTVRPTQVGPNLDDMHGLWRVREGCFMHLPKECEGMDRCWARAGTIIDLDDEFLRRVCAGQAFKLEEAPRGAVASVISDTRLKGYRVRLEQDAKRARVQTPAQKQAVEAAKASGLATSIPKPDARPKAKKPDEKAPSTEAAASA